MARLPRGITKVAGRGDSKRTYFRAFVEQGVNPDGSRKRVTRQFPTLADAKAWQDEQQANYRAGVRNTMGRTTLGAYLADWPHSMQPVIKKPRAKGTLKDYRGVVTKYLLGSPLASTRIADLEPEHFRAFYATLPDPADGGPGKTVRHRVHRTLYYAFTDLVNTNRIDRHPMRGVHADYAETEKVFWTPGNVRDFLGSIRGVEVGWSKRKPYPFDGFFTAVLLAAHTGMRLGEFLGLAWADVNLDEGKVFVRRGKHGSTRTLRIDPTAVAVLAKHKREQAAGFLSSGAGKPDHDLVFTYRNGAAVSHGAFQGFFKRAAAAAGMPEGSSVHTLRHTHAAVLLTSGWSVYKVSMRLGHRSVETTTKTYGHLLDADQLMGDETSTAGFDELCGTAALVRRTG